ncbi:unnamed protein product [Danaus chrysippus]|uniref:(African queen) hypothetical protein n=1 Tax=Danaus chrysippus TaxID=151541 RepID=A0A8J2R6Q2_9NEOP|nr:unnamed protein product [Danaus chrysippus]
MISIKNLKLGLFNPGSLGSHHDEFIVLMERHDADVVAINETWLRSGEDGRAPVVAGYRLRHIPRPVEIRSRGGGVGFYIKRGISVRTLMHPISPPVEQMWIATKINGKTIIIGTAYRPPWGNVTTFFDALTETIGSLPIHDHLYVLGDFNINCIDTRDIHRQVLDQFLSTHDLRQYVTEPTHFTANCESLIDLICSNTLVNQIRIDYVAEFGGHAFISCEVSIKRYKISPKTILNRPLKDINPEHLNETLNLMNWESVTDIEEINDMVAVFNSNLLWVFDLLAPSKLICFRENQRPWITYNIKLLMSRRDAAHVRAKGSTSETSISYYKDLKLQVD